jgi:branched-chain amino acid aminotransferase
MTKDLDWENIGFAYRPTDMRYVSYYRDEKWDEGILTSDPNVTLNECAGVLQYSQSCFEGLKAYTSEKGNIVIFRPDLNEMRMHDSCERLMIPPLPEGRFTEAVKKTVAANSQWVPPFGSGATLYIRPFLIGSGSVISVNPAPEYMFRVFCTPVGPYFKGGVRPLRLKVSEFDRAAPRGTGHIKAGLNYSMSLYATQLAHQQGYDENVYLDAATRTKLEETGGANLLFVDKNGTVVTPKSDSILPSVTRRSLMTVARDYLGLKCEEREINLDELKDMKECGLCGTAAVISPVGSIEGDGCKYTFACGEDGMGPVTKKLHELLTGIQMEKIDGPEGWVQKIL